MTTQKRHIQPPRDQISQILRPYQSKDLFSDSLSLTLAKVVLPTTIPGSVTSKKTRPIMMKVDVKHSS